MSVTRSTTIHQLIEEYPYLSEWLTGYAPEFRKLGKPVLYNTVARAATIEAAASLADIPAEQLLGEITTRIAEHEIAAEEGAGAPASGMTDVDRARRQDALKDIIRQLHEGASVDAVKAQFDAISAGIGSVEIAEMEQALIAGGMPPEEIQRLCDVHVSVFKDALDADAAPELDPSHPIAVYVRENELATQIVADLRRAVVPLVEAVTEGDPIDDARERVTSHLDRLAPLAVHYARKENQLFPALEAHGVEGPTKVMWGIDEDILQRLKTARSQADDPTAAPVLGEKLPALLLAIEDMIYKEEKILFPAALDALGPDEWAAIAAGDAGIGYAWIDPPAPWMPSEPCATPEAEAPGEQPSSAERGVDTATGRLSAAQFELLMRSVPFDLTFVDENDRVVYYSEGERVFPRSRAVIGREVRNCHPPKSVDKVEQILEAFKAGREDSAEFWIEMAGRFVNIRYFALRGEDGAYQGCLEVVQDATHVRSLVGQRRLLDW